MFFALTMSSISLIWAGEPMLLPATLPLIVGQAWVICRLLPNRAKVSSERGFGTSPKMTKIHVVAIGAGSPQSEARPDLWSVVFRTANAALTDGANDEIQCPFMDP